MFRKMDEVVKEVELDDTSWRRRMVQMEKIRKEKEKILNSSIEMRRQKAVDFMSSSMAIKIKT